MSVPWSDTQKVHLHLMYQLHGQSILDSQVADEVKEEAWEKIREEMNKIKTGVKMNEIKDQIKTMVKVHQDEMVNVKNNSASPMQRLTQKLPDLESKSEPEPSVSKQRKSPFCGDIHVEKLTSSPDEYDDQPDPPILKKVKLTPPPNDDDQLEPLVSKKRKSSPDDEYRRPDLFDRFAKYMADVLRLYPRTMAIEAHGKILEALQNQIVLLEEKLQSEGKFCSKN